MQVFIEDIVDYLARRPIVRPVVNIYFDTSKYGFQNDLSKMQAPPIIVPEIQERTMIVAYVQQSENEDLQNFVKGCWNAWDNVFADTFHDLVEHFRAYEDWLRFREKYIIEAAQRWCEENNIKYTLEHKYSDLTKLPYVVCIRSENVENL
jgi:hypothetical protein